jgi:hypothetical protein
MKLFAVILHDPLHAKIGEGSAFVVSSSGHVSLPFAVDVSYRFCGVCVQVCIPRSAFAEAALAGTRMTARNQHSGWGKLHLRFSSAPCSDISVPRFTTNGVQIHTVSILWIDRLLIGDLWRMFEFEDFTAGGLSPLPTSHEF